MHSLTLESNDKSKKMLANAKQASNLIERNLNEVVQLNKVMRARHAIMISLLITKVLDA